MQHLPRRLVGGSIAGPLFRAVAGRVRKLADRRGIRAPEPNPCERGITSLDSAIVMISLIIVGSVITMALLSTMLSGAEETKGAAFSGLAEAQGSVVMRGGATAIRGSVDINGDDVIDGSDQNAIVTVKFLVTGSTPESVIDLTPPYTFDSAGTDPDASGLASISVMTFNTEDVAINEAAWSVAFIGANNGDYFLEKGEKAEVTIWLQTNDIANSLWDFGTGEGDPFLDLTAELLQTDTPFEIGFDVGGGVITLGRTTPGFLDPIVYLE